MIDPLLSSTPFWIFCTIFLDDSRWRPGIRTRSWSHHFCNQQQNNNQHWHHQAETNRAGRFQATTFSLIHLDTLPSGHLIVPSAGSIAFQSEKLARLLWPEEGITKSVGSFSKKSSVPKLFLHQCRSLRGNLVDRRRAQSLISD